MPRTESKYYVVLLDFNDYELCPAFAADNLRDAKSRLNYLLSDEYAISGESTHQNMGTRKAEIRNRSDECIFDRFI